MTHAHTQELNRTGCGLFGLPVKSAGNYIITQKKKGAKIRGKQPVLASYTRKKHPRYTKL